MDESQRSEEIICRNLELDQRTVRGLHATTPAFAGLNDQERARSLALLTSLDRVTAN